MASRLQNRQSHRQSFFPKYWNRRGSPPPLTTRDRELVSVVGAVVEPGNRTKAFYSSRPGCRQSGVGLIDFFLK